MRFTGNNLLCFVAVLVVATAVAKEPVTDLSKDSLLAHWSFDDHDEERVEDASRNARHGTLIGKAKPAVGASGQSLRLDGRHDYIAVQDTDAFDFSDATFSVMAWANVYELNRGQQMIVAKNVYSADWREWGLMVDHDNHFRFYLHDGGWRTVGSRTVPKPGQWYHVAVTVNAGHASLYVNGHLEGTGKLGTSIPDTSAPLTIGGVDDGGRLRQMWYGALDEVRLHRGVLSPAKIQAAADRKTTPHEVPKPPAPYVLWKGGEMPKSADVPVLEGVRFSVLKRHEPEADGGNWLLGVALAWHKGKLYTSYGFNTGSENTASEEAHVRTSEDDGRSWGDVRTIDAGEGNLGVSHGVFLSRDDELWAFHGAFYDHFQRTHTRAYVLNETTGDWTPKGVVVDKGFWPMQEPQKMADGNWIMAGARVAFGYDGIEGHLPAVAISHGEDLTKWDLVVIATDDRVSQVWGESSVVVDGPRILNVSRWGGQARALAAVSTDYGRTWTLSCPSNLPMATSKPYTGTLSTGQNYLICTTTADSGGRRSPLTIAVSRPKEEAFSQVFVIRHALFPDGPGPSHANCQLCYPYAVEQAGSLYVGYAVKNHRTAEMAVIPISSLWVRDAEHHHERK
jgi:hypothetical protein